MRDSMMALELNKSDRAEAIASIERYFREHMDEAIGNVTAGALLGFFVQEVGPCLYNQGVADAQERMQARAAEIDFEVHAPEFSYWKNQAARGGKPQR